MKKKGFTLVELLAVIVILTLLLLLVVPNVINFLSSAEAEFTQSQKTLVIQAATMYVEDYKESIPELKEEYGSLTITLQTLGDEGYITLPLYDAKSKEEIDPTGVKVIVIRNEYGRFEYSISGVR